MDAVQAYHEALMEAKANLAQARADLATAEKERDEYKAVAKQNHNEMRREMNCRVANQDSVRRLETALEKAEADLARVRETLTPILERIASWSQETQDRAVDQDMGVMLWRGCVAEANTALAALLNERKEGR